ncbi:MAG: hypothetical protein L6R38_007213 [Xanthoria sp. 2 TBL-2021]|nr:MAG: hypothetical protein L6R38_007213 [Xanthoria sp. 2 TBL-2021]
MYYLEPSELYASEKPYFVSFPVDGIEGATQSNIKQSQHSNINVSDIRGHEEDFTLDNTGFEFSRFDSKFTYADFDNFDSIKDAYFEEVATFLRTRLRAG